MLELRVAARTVVGDRETQALDEGVEALRGVVALGRESDVRAEAVRYLNRLSDLLFVIARVLARASGNGEVLWQHERRKR